MAWWLKLIKCEEAGSDGAASGGAADAGTKDPSAAGNAGAGNGTGQGDAAGGNADASLLGGRQSAEPDKSIPAKFPDNWRDLMTVEGDDKSRSQLERFKSPADVVKAYRELQKKMSSGEYKKAQLAEDASPEELAQWRKENGVPEKKDDYLEGLPDGVVIGDADKERANSFLEAMLGKNVPKDIVQAAISWNQNNIAEQMNARQEAMSKFNQDAEDKLREEFGGDYRRNMNLAFGLMNTMPEEAKTALTQAIDQNGMPLGSNPALISWLVGMARQTNPVATVVPGASSPQAVTDEISKIEKVMRTDPDSYYKDKGMQKRLLDLYDVQEKLGL